MTSEHEAAFIELKDWCAAYNISISYHRDRLFFAFNGDGARFSCPNFNALSRFVVEENEINFTTGEVRP